MSKKRNIASLTLINGWKTPHLRVKLLIYYLSKTQHFYCRLIKESLINNKISFIDRSMMPFISLAILNDKYKLGI